MDDKDKVAIETEISTEQKIITDAEGVITADQAKLAADSAPAIPTPAAVAFPDTPASPVVDGVQVTGATQPAPDAAPAQPQPTPATPDVAVTADPAPSATASTASTVAVAPDPAPTDVATETGDAPQPSEPAPVATVAPAAASDPIAAIPASDLSTDHVTPLPGNELGPIVPDTAEAGAGEIVKPPRQEWTHKAQPPSMGRIVHYRAANSGESPDGNEFHAALITKVNEDWTVSLSVFPEGRNPMFVSNVAYGDGDAIEDVAPGMWGWPARV